MSSELDCCVTIARLLAGHGISEIVISPGSRNAPLIQAIVAEARLKTTIVVDERSAAFVALGKASISMKCVALVCTSGTAMLNYAPALAEAKYRGVPLLVITADRPHGMIERNEPQTINQPGAYGLTVKQSYNVIANEDSQLNYLVINDAIIAAVRYPQGPVHLNVEIPNPSIGEDINENITNDAPIIKLIEPSGLLSVSDAKALAANVQSPAKVLIAAGLHAPSQKINKAISRLCTFGNFVAIADSIANIQGKGIIKCADTVISGCTENQLDSLKPDIVITYGGPILSDKLKGYLKSCKAEHWHIGVTSRSCDTFSSLTTRIETSPETFFSQLVSVMRKNGITSNYNEMWQNIADAAVKSAKEYIAGLPWCDLTAINTALSLIPRSFNVQLSNGMTVRYAQTLPFEHHRADCNRGTSGIEGSTSTAVGASTEYNGGTVLITGDMSAFYDMSAICLPFIPSRFKMIVINNGGGGIFNYIKGTRDFNEVDKFMVVKQNYDISAVAQSSGFSVYTAENFVELKSSLNKMITETGKPGLLIIQTSAAASAGYMLEYINRNNINNDTKRVENN